MLLPIRWLLRYTDIDPMSSAKNGETPAHVAGAHGHVEILKVSQPMQSTSVMIVFENF